LFDFGWEVLQSRFRVGGFTKQISGGRFYKADFGWEVLQSKYPKKHATTMRE